MPPTRARDRARDADLLLLAAILAVVLLGLVFLLGESFFSARNFQSMAYQIPEFGFLALAMSLAMLTGGIDLSAVATANLSGILAAYLLSGEVLGGAPEELRVAAAVVVALGTALACGLGNGALIAELSVPPILATLGTMTLYTGAAMALTAGKGIVGFPESFLALGTGTVARVPLVFVCFLLGTVALSLLLGRTTFGRSVYLLGANPVASRFSGIRNERVLLATYAGCGVLAGCSALIIISRVNSAKVGYGDTYLLQAILVAVLGGIDPDGGRGRLWGVLLGICVLQSLQSAFTLFTFTPYAKKLIWGFMLLLVMGLKYAGAWLRERADRRRALVAAPRA